MRWLSNPWDGGEGYKVDQYAYLLDDWYYTDEYKRRVAARRRDMEAVMVGRVDDGDDKGERQMTRQEHMDWCKRRALELVDAGDAHGAFASMVSDLGKHNETANHVGIQLGMMQLMGGLLGHPEQMRHFIEGFN